MCPSLCVTFVTEILTNELLVPDVQSHVSEGGSHSTNHPVVVYPQQLHQDRETFLFAHCSSDVNGPLGRSKGAGRQLDTTLEILFICNFTLIDLPSYISCQSIY